MSILVRNGYISAGIGKLFHHQHTNPQEYTHGTWDGDWYKYQNAEEAFLNSSVTPDDSRPIEWFRDYQIADVASDKMRALSQLSSSEGRPFLLTVGFKLPHLQYHVPRRYFDMYRHNSYLTSILSESDSNTSFPDGVPLMNYRCCGQLQVSYLNHDGRLPSVEASPPLPRRMVIPARARMELMWGYLSGITFLDAMLGRLVDVLEGLDIANNTVLVVTSDHGMHVGEKGMWEKYTLWEETTRVPLIVSHPGYRQSWGQRHSGPVELVDVLPTLLDLLEIPYVPVLCPRSRYCADLDGKSLARYVRRGRHLTEDYALEEWMVPPGRAVTQVRRCPFVGGYMEKRTDRQSVGPPPLPSPLSPRHEAHISKSEAARKKELYTNLWNPMCNKKNVATSLMGYSLRTLDYRYTAWFEYDNEASVALTDREIVAEELYCHKGDHVSDINTEKVNLAALGAEGGSACAGDDVKEVLSMLRQELVTYIRRKFVTGLDNLNTRTVKRWRGVYELDKNMRPAGIAQPHLMTVAPRGQ